MPLTADLIQPAASPAALPIPTSAPAPTAPAAPVAPALEATKGAPKIPEDVQNNPVVKDVLAGRLPGVLVRPGVYYPKAFKIAESMEGLIEVGLDLYFAQDESTVLFNPIHLSAEELQTADSQGKLHQIVPDYETISGERPGKPPKGTKLGYGYSQAPAASQAPSTPTGGAGPAAMALPPAGSQEKIANERVNRLNIAQGSPSSGPIPGGGRVLNAAVAPAI